MTELFSQSNVSFVLRTLLRLGAPNTVVEDLAQEVFLIVHRNGSTFDTSKKVQPWLYGIARNLMREYWRKTGHRREQLGGAGDVASGALLWDSGIPNTEVDMVRKAVSHLAEPLLDILVLRDMMGMTLSEAADELSIPFDTAKDRLRRARFAVKTLLEKWQEEVERG